MRLFLLVFVVAAIGCTRPNGDYSAASFVQSGDLGSSPSAPDLAVPGAASGRDLGSPPADLAHVKVVPDLAHDLAPALPPDLAPAPPVPCEVDGQDGVCLDVSQCFGVATAGHCPGPATIQCCTSSIVPPVPPLPVP